MGGSLSNADRSQHYPCNMHSADYARALFTQPSVLRVLTGRDDLAIRFMHRSCANAVRQVGLTCAAIDIVESSCTPRSRMLVDAMMLHPHASMQRGGGCGMQLFGAANNMAPVFVSFKSRQRDATHAVTSITQRLIRSAADAESPRGKST